MRDVQPPQRLGGIDADQAAQRGVAAFQLPDRVIEQVHGVAHLLVELLTRFSQPHRPGASVEQLVPHVLFKRRDEARHR
ncbi:hypothetical protein D3C71_2000100 [compost metagenome]